MQEESHTFIEFLAWITGAGFVMAYARWLSSKEPHQFRVILGEAIINAFAGSTALIVFAIKPNISDLALYGIAFSLLLIGPVTLKILIMRFVKSKLD